MKKTIWVMVCIIAIVLGFFVGKHLYKKEESNNNVNLQNTVTNTQINNTVEKVTNTEIPTSMSEEKVSINTEIIEKVYYKECDHIIETPVKNIEKYINMDEEDIRKSFQGWEIEEFTPEKLVLYKQEEDFCNEHFLIKDVDGYVTIYTLNSLDNVLEILETTEIETKYLTDTDKKNLIDGIKVYTKKDLNKVIEDFE
ncbi:MAG: BofC C-terminal domain-containing protein [Clostridia bacterium]